jgi:hypothetical protein
MYRSFTIKNFRCFRELTIEPLERVNLIAGMNNVGKTALLEAIFLHLGANNPALAVRINTWRGITDFDKSNIEDEMWGSLFFDYATSATIELEGKDENGHRRSLRISLSKSAETELPTGEEGNGHIQNTLGSMTTTIPARELKLAYSDDIGQSGDSRAFIREEGIKIELASLKPFPQGAFFATRVRTPAEDAKRFSKLEAVGRQDEILPMLKLLEPRLRRLAVLVTGEAPMVNGDIGAGRLIPMTIMGQGIGRIMSLALAIFDSPRGVVLIDEIENGLHYSAMVGVWKAIAEAARRSDTQIFATTHSWECIQAAHEAFSASGTYDFRLHRLDRVKDEIRVATYDQEMLDAAMATDLEVR